MGTVRERKAGDCLLSVDDIHKYQIKSIAYDEHCGYRCQTAAKKETRTKMNRVDVTEIDRGYRAHEMLSLSPRTRF